jgi:undecaprenyl diphosphate synthase
MQTNDGIHVGIIMDGNGRWATARGLPRTLGHQAGVAAVSRTCAAAPGLGIRALTLFAFSSDNWKRPAPEVEGMMAILRHYLRHETEGFVREGVRISVIGRRDRIPADLAAEIAAAEEATRGGRRLHVRVAIDYCGRESILRAARAQVASGTSPVQLRPPA